MLRKLPLPIAGLILALAVTGNLIQSYSENIRLIFGLVSFVLFIFLTIKIVFNFNDFKNEMKNPIIASVMPTYSMALMLLSGYLKPYIGNTANIIWYLAVVLHIIFIIYFTKTFIINFKEENIFPSWFIVYVGIVVASITGKVFNQAIGVIAFYFGLVSYLILLFIVIKRLAKNTLPEPALPTKTILAAPGSLCLAGYINIVDNKSLGLVIFLLGLSQIIYFYIILSMPKMLKIKFYPSYSGFTFPIVISAVALKLTAGYFNTIGINIPFLKYLVLIETIIAVAIVLYVLYKYMVFLFKPSMA